MLHVVTRLVRGVMRRARLYRYDDFTIAEHFRSQGAQVGSDCRLLIRDIGSEPYLIRIGNHCTIAANVALITHDGGTWVFTEQVPDVQRFGAIEILDNCFIGYGAIILPDVRIGPNAVVAAGAVVTKDVPPGTVVAGCPARSIATLEEYRAATVAAWVTQRPAGYFAGVRDGARHSPAQILSYKLRDAGILRRHLERIFWGR